MIEVTILNYLTENLAHPVYMEEPDNPPTKYYLLEKTGAGQNDRLFSATFALQSYAPSMYEAAEMNDTAKPVMLEAWTLPELTRVRLNSDYNYTDTQTKRYRYQAVYNITHY